MFIYLFSFFYGNDPPLATPLAFREVSWRFGWAFAMSSNRPSLWTHFCADSVVSMGVPRSSLAGVGLFNGGHGCPKFVTGRGALIGIFH